MLSKSSIIVLGALASVQAAALPFVEIPHLSRRDDEFLCYNNSISLPNITIYATGGTIAGSSNSATNTAQYSAGQLGVATLVNAVPALCERVNVRGVQISNVDSGNVNQTILLELAHAIQKDLDSEYTTGIVVTHGTDTLEESAFFLDLTVRSEKPVVIVGAMRPATAISADGPVNLLAAATVAAADSAKGRGALIVLNDRISGARYTTKNNANTVDTFTPGDHGYMGVMYNLEPIFWYPPTRPYGYHYTNVSSISVEQSLPQVDILFGHQDLDVKLMDAAIANGAKGLVLAGMGAGGWSSKGTAELEKVISAANVPAVFSRRTTWGYVSSKDGLNVGGGFLNPQHCRIQLQLLLAEGLPIAAIHNVFEW